MSRIGKLPIKLPPSIETSFTSDTAILESKGSSYTRNTVIIFLCSFVLIFHLFERLSFMAAFCERVQRLRDM